MNLRNVVVAVAVTLLAAACVTINVYFPEAAIKDLSKQIEEQVAKEAAEKAAQEIPPPPPPPAEPQGSQSRRTGSPSVLEALLGIGVAHAEEVAAPEVTSPEIRKIIESRAARLADLSRFKTQGVLGETNEGLLEARNLESLPDLKARAEVQRLARSENTDREALYKEIAAAKGVDLSQLPKIRETYAATLRDNAKPGEWIQMPDGSWKQK